MSYRSDAVNVAIKEWQAHPEGRPALYWQDVLIPGESPPVDWCGAFFLWALHQAGIANNQRWIVGTGFAAPAGLETTNSPQPGDLLYLAEPFQHHAMVVSYEPRTGMITSIDGNQPGILPKVRFRNANTSFYSIQPLVDQAEAAASGWGYAVAGAVLAGAAAWVWFHGLPGPVDRALKRLAA